MTNYQIDLTVSAYFNKLMESGINEKNVKDFGQKDGVLYIKLDDGKIIEEKIKNFYN